jgi:hypothetical protein
MTKYTRFKQAPNQLKCLNTKKIEPQKSYFNAQRTKDLGWQKKTRLHNVFSIHESSTHKENQNNIVMNYD